VDDDEDSRSMLTALLAFALIDATAVGNAAQALSLMQAERFDLYLLDVWLPGIDGFELCRRIRASDTQIPILFFSGAAYESDRKRGMDAGANAYVIKPEVDILAGVIMQFVSRTEAPTAKIIPFDAKQAPSGSFTFAPAAA
jgi:DNA-binding response OmpR family regulator